MTRDERFEACFLKYKNLVMRFVIDATGDYQAAQEICQQVFVRYYEYIDRVSPDFEKAWLIRCTQNAVIDYLRKNKRRKELFLETPIGEVRDCLLYTSFRGLCAIYGSLSGAGNGDALFVRKSAENRKKLAGPYAESI